MQDMSEKVPKPDGVFRLQEIKPGDQILFKGDDYETDVVITGVGENSITAKTLKQLNGDDENQFPRVAFGEYSINAPRGRLDCRGKLRGHSNNGTSAPEKMKVMGFWVEPVWEKAEHYRPRRREKIQIAQKLKKCGAAVVNILRLEAISNGIMGLAKSGDKAKETLQARWGERRKS